MIRTLALGIAVVLVACSGSTARLESDIARIEKNLEDLRNIQAEHTTVVASVRNEQRALSGRMEELEFSQRGVSSLQRDLSSLQNRVPPPKEVPQDALESDEALAGMLPLASGERFRNALRAVRLGNFAEATPSFEDLISESAGESWNPNVIFWLAVCYEANGEAQKAVTAYHDISTAFPKHTRVPLALLRQGTTFLKLGDREPARLTFKKIVAMYPKSKEAEVAKQKLQSF